MKNFLDNIKFFFKNTENKFKDKIENLEERDKISLFIGMLSFLILINFSDFSGFKASLVSTGTGETTQEIIQEENQTENQEKDNNENNNENNIKQNTEESEVETSKNSIENEILEGKISELKEEIKNENNTENQNIKISENIKTEENKNKEIIISENPVLTENSTQTGEMIEGNSEEISKIKDNIENTKDFLEEVSIDRNAETLALLKAEENQNNEIEVISDTTQNFDTENNKNEKSENINPETKETSEVKTELGQQIETVIQNIQEIETENEIQKKAEELAAQIVSQQEQKSTGLPEDDFTVSGEETQAYNELARKKKEDEIINKYEKQIEEQKAKEKDLLDRLEMLENKLKDKEIQKTPEQIAEEKKQMSLREIAKKEAEEKLKILEAKRAEELRILNIEKEKRLTSLETLRKDSDGDGLSDHIEKIIETNPKLIDTDGDGYGDKVEIEKFFSPNSEGVLFSDITERDSKKSVIISGVKKGLVFVRTGDKFLPKEKIYRNEAIKIIVSAMYPSEIYREDEFFEGVELYSDTSSSDDYARYLAIAIKHGILDGIIADNFNPYGTFTKAEFITILVNASGKSESNKKLKWADTEYDNWFTGYFSKAKELGIIKTETYNRIFPLNEISRYEAILYSIRASKYGN